MARERRKVRVGRVVSDRMDKTVVVAVEWSQRHPLYKKPMKRVSKFYAHDRDNSCREGDTVRIEETRPISGLKRWRVVEVLARKELPEVKPAELDQEAMEEATGQRRTQVTAAPDQPAVPEGQAGGSAAPEGER